VAEKSPQSVPFLKAWWSRAAKNTFIEAPIAAGELSQAMREAARPVLGFYLMLTLATIIGTSGLLSNSAGIIIGAMIVAPLMNPIVALAHSIGRSHWRVCGVALFSLISGVLLVVLLAYVGTELLGLRIAGSEILGRTQPTLLDLGVAIAAGAAAGFANSRKSIANILPGTAISVALVPPLCVVGIGLAAGGNVVADAGIAFVPLGPDSTGLDIAWGAFLLFAANLAGIVLAAELVFILQGYGTLRRGAIGFLASLVAAFILIRPLGISLRTLYSRSVAMKVATRMADEQAEKGVITGAVLATRAYYIGDHLNIDVKVMVPESEKEILRERARLFQERVSKVLQEPVQINVQSIVAPIEHFVVKPRSE
jgi:uncharacterized hydrophobic protein (TIGR00271 family)